jgi:hypothetical protein
MDTNMLYFRQKKIKRVEKYKRIYVKALRNDRFLKDLWKILDYIMVKIDRTIWIELLFRYENRFINGHIRGTKLLSNGRWSAKYNGKRLGVFDTQELAYRCILAYKSSITA